MKKTLVVSLCLITAAIAANAQVLFEDTFDTYGTNVLLFDKGDWTCPTNAFTVTTNEIEGSTAWQKSTLVGHDFSLGIEESVTIEVDNVFDVSGNTAGMYAGIENTATNISLGVFTSFNSWAGGSIRYHTEFFEWWTSGTTSTAAWSNDAGFVVGSDTITDPLRMSWTIFRSATTNEFNIKVEYENLVSGASGSATETVTDTNLWNAASYELYFGKGHAGLVTYDNFKAEKFAAPVDLVLWEDDFSTAYNGQEIQWSAVWRATGNNGGWEGTNAGHMVQRPTTSTNNTSGAGFRGAVYYGTPFAPSTGEASIVKFDWTAFTFGRENRPFLDIMMTTNFAQAGDNFAVGQDYLDAFTHMGFRIEQNAWPGPLDGQSTSNGAFRAIFAQSTAPSVTNFITPEFLGLAPEDGDNESDPIEVSYIVEKRASSNNWTISLLMSNETTAATWTSDEIDVVDAAFYVETNFYFTGWGPSDFASQGTGNHFDNFVGINRRFVPPPISGWTLFKAAYGLTGAALADADSDGVDDIAEFALGGNPTNAANTGTAPVLLYGGDDNVRFYVNEVSSTNSGIIYTVGKRDDLTSGSWLDYPTGWNFSDTNSNVATNNTSNDTIIYDEVLYQFWGGAGAADENFIRLTIEEEQL